jgi:hypothetical protein
VKNADRLALCHPGVDGFVYIERNRRNVSEVIGTAACKVMQQVGRCPPYILVGWHDYHLLRNELELPWSDGDPITVCHPAGRSLVLVDPSVEIGVRALPSPGDYARYIQHPSLLKAK